jgi:hypothetical protein
VTEHATCTHCARVRKLDQHGLVVTHYLTIPVSRPALKVVGAGRVRRKCSGSGKAPRRPLGTAS